ncbi:hypothetical protein K474DRAFT_1396285 [Panus rudis PR-1116 ss-1]|nr:hypothetical protein K474DRAFT_1396285 [Panus rudis PR-1116 ss-1]
MSGTFAGASGSEGTKARGLDENRAGEGARCVGGGGGGLRKVALISEDEEAGRREGPASWISLELERALGRRAAGLGDVRTLGGLLLCPSLVDSTASCSKRERRLLTAGEGEDSMSEDGLEDMTTGGGCPSLEIYANFGTAGSHSARRPLDH